MKFITTKLVTDIETGAVLERTGFWYAGPIAEAKPGKSDPQKAAEAASAADRAKQGQLTDTAQGTLGQFEGPVDQSPFYKALLTQGTEATSNAYQNAQQNVRARAKQAGFGYEQPVEQGAEAGIQAQEAGALARVPGEALLEASGPALSAAGQTGSMGMGYGQQGLGYNTNAGNMEARRVSFWDKLLQSGQAAAKDAALASGG